MEKITACTLDCHDACSLLIKINKRGELRIRGNPQHPITRGFTCRKIKKFPNRLNSSSRIKSPLIRDGDNFKKISWNEAIDTCVNKINALRNKPLSILHIQGGAYKGVLQHAPRYFFLRLGSTQIRGSLCDEAGISAMIADFGALDMNDISLIENAKRIVNWGRDVDKCSLHLTSLMTKAHKKGARILLISPGGEEPSHIVDDTIRIRPGTDRFLAIAVIKLLLENDKINDRAISRIKNWPAFRSIIERFSINELLDITQLSKKDLTKIYDYYEGEIPTATIIGWGLQRYIDGGETVRYINALSMLTGNIGIPEGGSYFNISSQRNFNLKWIVPEEKTHLRTLLLPRIGHEIMEASNPKIKMVWVNASNVVNQAPNSRLIIEAFKKIKFKVVVDTFMTDTAKMADLILPCALMFEKEDVVGSYLHNYINFSRKIVEPPDGVKTDHWIISEIAKRIDPPIYVPEEKEFIIRSLASPYIDTSFEELKEKGFIRAKRPSIAFEGLKFSHPDGLYRLPEAISEAHLPSDDYPLRLLSLIRKSHIHSQILPEEHINPPEVVISNKCICLKDIDLTKDTYLSTPVGRIKVHVKVREDIHPDVVIYRRGDWMMFGGGVNQIITDKVTDIGENAAFYSEFARLEN